MKGHDPETHSPKRLTKRRGIAKWLFFTPIGCAVLYAALTIGFAIIFSQCPEQFYHSAIRYEPALKRELTDFISQLQSALITNALKNEKLLRQTKPNDIDWKADFKNLQIIEPEFHDEDLVFALRVSVIKIATNGTPNYEGYLAWKLNLHPLPVLTNNQHAVVSFDVTDSQSLIPDPLPQFGSGSEDIKYCILPLSAEWPAWPDGSLAVAAHLQSHCEIDLDPALGPNWRALQQAYKGLPTGSWNNFWRMLYFSIVTIATLGYGDIIPLTGLTRTLAGLEVVVGLGVAGLFINSCFEKLKDRFGNE